MKLIIYTMLFLSPVIVFAAELDSDGDGLSDDQEINLYYLNPYNADTDGDGYDDNLELINGYSPHFAGKRLIEVDQDGDGLNDGYELALHTDLKNPDTDGDGYLDGDEFFNEYDPTNAEPVKLNKSIGVDLSDQQMWYSLGPVRLSQFTISTGKASTPTPTGVFEVQNKFDRPFSNLAGLYMPFWMAFNGPYGMHELPEWPGGAKEGADHLGIPVSHGCIRMGHENAVAIYNWADIGTPVIINE